MLVCLSIRTSVCSKCRESDFRKFQIQCSNRIGIGRRRKRHKQRFKKIIRTNSEFINLIDEVHHAATDDIKLRQAVNYWHSKGNITTVLGFSGTPYLQGARNYKSR
jgi:type III restriction enzyme